MLCKGCLPIACFCPLLSLHLSLKTNKTSELAFEDPLHGVPTESLGCLLDYTLVLKAFSRNITQYCLCQPLSPYHPNLPLASHFQHFLVAAAKQDSGNLTVEVQTLYLLLAQSQR